MVGMKKIVIPFFRKRKEGHSLAYDYFLFALFIIVIALCSSAWFVWKNYYAQKKAVEDRLALQAQLVDGELASYIQYVAHIAEDKGYKIALWGANDLKHIDYMFKRRFLFKKTTTGLKDKIFRWPHFSWIDTSGKVVVKSEYGVLPSPVSIPSEKHLFLSSGEYWQLHFSDVQYDAERETVYIDASLGITDVEGAYVGTIMTRFEVDKIVKAIKERLVDDNVSFLILNDKKQVVMQSDFITPLDKDVFAESLKDMNVDVKKATILPFSLFYQGNLYKAYKPSTEYPFIILTGYNPNLSSKEFWLVTTERLVEIFAAVIFILAILFIYRRKLVKPIEYLAEASKTIGAGDTTVDTCNFTKNGRKGIFPVEIYELQKGLETTKSYIKEVQEVTEKLQKSNITLGERTKELERLKTILEEKRDVARKSKGMREKFLSEVQKGTVEGAVNAIINEITHILEKEKGIVQMSKKEIQDALEGLLRQCAKIITFTSDEVVLSEVDVEEIIYECVAIQSEDADIKEVDLITRINKNIPRIQADKLKLRQVISALIYYALEDRKVGRKSFIRISACRWRWKGVDALRLIFVDNGHGLSEEERSQMEEVWSEEEDNALKKNNGTALGLIAVRHLLALHKGVLRIRNKRGKGNVMTVNIPYGTLPQEESSTTKTKKSSNKPAMGKNVLVFKKK